MEKVLIAPAHVQNQTERLFKKLTTSGRIEIKDRFFLQALRSVGYDVYTAIAELIDNSIDAGATIVTLTYDPKSGTLTITDNGRGMSMQKLDAAMDLGADQEYSEDQIGYFGSGMKTAIINLVTGLDSEITIESNNGVEYSQLTWRPIKNFREYDAPIPLLQPSIPQGTKITINGVERFQLATLKKQLGVVFYPTLKTETLTLRVNEVDVIGNDPLYRYSEKTRTNHVTAKVMGHEIRIEAVLLHPEQEKNSWDSSDGAEARFSFSKGGAYTQYGGRYIEYGGLLHVVTDHPDFNWVRFEFAIPKELTEAFGVKFNKTKGLDLSRKKEKNESLSDLIQKIKDMLNWGKDQRQKMKVGNASTEDKSELGEITKKLNEAARKARFKKPSTTSVSKEDGLNEETFDDVPTTDLVDEKEKQPTKTKIHKFELYDIRFDNLGNTAVFWHLGYEYNKFIITINDGHVFYTEYWVNMNDTAKTAVSFLLGAIAQAQYNTIKDSENLQDVRTDFFFEDFWSQVSVKLRHLTLS